jgi:hypothetical protein
MQVAMRIVVLKYVTFTRFYFYTVLWLSWRQLLLRSLISSFSCNNWMWRIFNGAKETLILKMTCGNSMKFFTTSFYMGFSRNNLVLLTECLGWLFFFHFIVFRQKELNNLNFQFPQLIYRRQKLHNSKFSTLKKVNSFSFFWSS